MGIWTEDSEMMVVKVEMDECANQNNFYSTTIIIIMYIFMQFYFRSTDM